MADNETPGLVVLPDGFRRVTRAPGAPEVGRVRALLSQAARGQTRTIAEGLGVLGSWQNASTITELLPPGSFGRQARSRALLRRVLSALGARPTAADALATVPRGSPARVQGRILRSRGKVDAHIGHIWCKGEIRGHNVRLLVEEGHDFFLGGSEGCEHEEVLVVAHRGWLADGIGTVIDVNDLVEVWGFADQLVEDGTRLGSSKPRGEPIALALCAGDDLPLVLRKISATAPPSSSAGNASGRRLV